jgi:hypothetical protein
VTTPTAQFAIALKDETSGPAEAAANALVRLKSQIDRDVRALGEMQTAMKRLQGAAQVDINAFRQLNARIDAQKSAIASAQAEYLGLGGTFGRVAKAAKAPTESVSDLVEGLKKVPGPIGGIVSRFASLTSATQIAIVGTFAMIAAIGALVVATIAATAALASYGVAQADARRSELLRLEGITTIRRHQGLAAGSGRELQEAIDRVSDSAAIGRSDVARYAEQLHRMGLRGGNLQQALEGVATVASVQGDRMASRFMGMSAAIARAGGSVRGLADDVRARLGGIAARQALSLGRQFQRLQESLSALFSGLRIEGFLGALHEVTSLFSQSTASGRALKTILETIFNPILDALGTVGPFARRFFQGLVIGALLITIAVLRARNALRDAFGDSGILAGIDGQRAALGAGLLVVSGLAGAVTVLAAALALLAAPFAAAFVAGSALTRMLAEQWELVRDTDWGLLGRDIIEGIVGGLQRGVGAIGDAMRGLATSATVAFESALGIRSPSRVFAELGVQLPRGLAVGVERGSPEAAGAVERMVEVPMTGPVEAPADVPEGAGVAARSSTTATIGPFYVTVGGGDARENAESFVGELAQLLEGVGIRMGAPA